MADPKKTIKEALEELDSANDDHWTGDGLPDLKTVRGIVGSKVTREEVTNEAPYYTRDHCSHEAPEGTESEEGDEEEVEEDETGEDAEKAAAEFTRLNELATKMDEEIEQMKRDRAELQIELDKAHDRNIRLNPPQNQATMIQDYQRSQHNLRRQAAGLEPE